MGFTTETEAMRSLFCCCCCCDPSPESPATAPIEDPVEAELRRFGLSRTELEKRHEKWDLMESIRAEQAAEAESDPEKAYELWRRKVVLSGSDETCRKMNVLIDDNIKRFCENDELFAGENDEQTYWEIDQRCQKAVPVALFHRLDMHETSFYTLANNRFKSASQQLAINHAFESIRLQREGIFWLVLFLNGYRQREELNFEIYKLKKMEKDNGRTK